MQILVYLSMENVDYLLLCFVGRTTGDYFYVVASENDTSVQVISKESFRLEAGQSKQLAISSIEYIAIQSDKPILVTQVCCIIILYIERTELFII